MAAEVAGVGIGSRVRVSVAGVLSFGDRIFVGFLGGDIY